MENMAHEIVGKRQIQHEVMLGRVPYLSYSMSLGIDIPYSTKLLQWKSVMNFDESSISETLTSKTLTSKTLTNRVRFSFTPVKSIVELSC